MKRFILTLALMIIAAMPACALSMKVSSMQDFTTEKPSDTLKVMVLVRTELDNGMVFEEGTIIKGDIFDVKPPTRGKRNATFKFRPTSYSYNGKMVEIKDNTNFWGKYAPYKELDAAGMTLSAATFVGGQVLKVPFLGQAVSFAKGVVKNPDGNRLKSGATQIYKDSFVSYVEEGKEITLKKDELFMLKFKLKDEEEENENERENRTDEPVNAENTENPPAQEVEIKNQTQPSAPLPSTEAAPAKLEQSTIHSVDPYEVLHEVEASRKDK